MAQEPFTAANLPAGCKENLKLLRYDNHSEGRARGVREPHREGARGLPSFCYRLVRCGV